MKECFLNQQPEGTLIISDHQLQGRGRRQSKWDSIKNKSLTFSFLLLPEIAFEKLGLLPLITGVSIVILSGSGSDSLRLLGDSLGLIAAIFYAAYILAIKKLTDSIPPVHTLFFATLFTAVFLFPVGFVEADSFFPSTQNPMLID